MITARTHFGSIRFGSRLFSKINRFGSVRFGNVFFPVRRGSTCVFRTRRGSVQFGSVPRPVLASSGIKRFGSVRFGRFGSVSHSFPIIIRIVIILVIMTTIITIIVMIITIIASTIIVIIISSMFTIAGQVPAHPLQVRGSTAGQPRRPFLHCGSCAPRHYYY